MFKTDIHTFLLILGVNKLIFGTLIFVLKKKNPDFPGINYWAYGSILTALGLISYSFMPPNNHPVYLDFIFSLTLNTCVYIGDVIFLAGFWKLENKKIRKSIFIIPAIAVFSVVYFTLFNHLIWARYTVNALLGTVLYFISAVVLFKMTNKSLRTVFKVSSMIYIFYGILQFVRAYFAILHKPVNATYANRIDVILIAIAGLFMLILTFNLILIITLTLNEQLNEQIKSKNKLYAILAHDLRGPIGNFLNYAQLLKLLNEKDDKEKTTNIINELVKISASSRFLLENLLNWSLSRLHEVKLNKQLNNLNLTIEESIAAMQNMAIYKKVEIKYESNNIHAFFDRDMIFIVLNNLLMNAIKYSQNNTNVEIQAQNYNEYIEVKIIDNGIGIEESKTDLIFQNDKFVPENGTANEKGYGLGLALCKDFLTLNNGFIKIESYPSKGTTVIFTLPVK